MVKKEIKNLENTVPTEMGQFLLYVTNDEQTRIEVKLANDMVWLSLNQMADLFGRDKSVISKHISNIFLENELLRESVVANFATTANDGKTYQVDHYNLDLIISVGYRVKSQRGTQFRIWATERLREYLIKGFTMDDERLKQNGGGSYFDELLVRIRDIRSSEKIFWKKVLEIYATSIDYDPKNDISVEFFKVLQNKMHWAAHGHTAAEIIEQRADASKQNMGLTNWQGQSITRSDISVAKNYLDEKELNLLNRIVVLYLDFAELQAIEQKPMTMQEWIQKLDDFLKLSQRDILTHAGKISHENALKKAEQEFYQYNQMHLNSTSTAEKDFEMAIKNVKKIEKTKFKK
jgi:hypothetical protein